MAHTAVVKTYAESAVLIAGGTSGVGLASAHAFAAIIEADCAERASRTEAGAGGSALTSLR